MADLGEAVLKLTVDDSELTTRLGELRRELETLSSAGTRGTRSTRRTSRGGGGAVDPGQIDALTQAARELNLNTNWGKALRVLAEVDNDLALIAASQQFNLANSWSGALTQLTEIQQDLALVAGGERLNLNTSWGAALAQLSEIDSDLKLVSAGERINLNSSWTAALGQLRETDSDLKLVAAGEQLNLNASWASALDQLREIDSDLKLVASGEQLNLNSSWTSALEQLREIDGDLKLLSASEQLNLRASWTTALEQLREVDADLRFIAAGQDLNLRTGWATALAELAEIDADLRLISGGRQLNIATSWGNFLQQLEDTKLDLDRARGGPSSPISGRLSNGGAIPGSPAAGRDAFNEASAQLEEALQQQIARRVNSSEAIIAEQQRIIAEAKKEVAASKKLAAAKDKAAKAEAAAAEQRSREGRKRLGEAAGNALIGGAFPALFGQGLGASIGGAAGGGLGGLLGGNFGFGLSLVGTALGQRFDDINKALENPIANFDQLKTSGALSSKSLEKYAEGLIETGRTAEAAAVIQRDLAGTFGANNLRAFAELRSASDELNRSFGEAAGSVSAFVAGPLAALLRAISQDLNNFGTATRFESLADDLNPEQYRRVRDVTDRATRDAQRARGGLPFLPPSEGDVAKGRQAGIEEARRLLGIKEEEKRLEEAIARARLQTTQELSNNYRLISAQVQGNRTAQLDERANTAIDERNKRLRELAAQKITDPNDARVVDANQTAAKELFRIEEERLQLQREINRTIAEEALKRGQIAQQIEATRARRDAALAAGDFNANPGNSFLGARAGAAEGAAFLAQNQLRVEQAITAERRLQAQLAFESDPTKRSQIAQQLTTAAAEVRAAGVEAGAALAERAATAAQSLRSAQDSLRGTLQSNFRLLPQAQRQGLLDAARADIARGRENGIIRDTIRPVGRARTFEIADFVRNVEQQQAQVASQQALIDALNTNSNAERNIRINVTLNGDGSANVSQTEQQAALL